MKYIIYLCLFISIAANIQEKIYLNAKANIGETAWAKDKERQAKRNKEVLFNKGEYKCNLFVYEMILESGYDIGTPNIMRCFTHPILCILKKSKRPPCTIDWYNEKVPGMFLVGEGDEGRKNCKAGDIITDGTHVGIVSKNKNQTISATSEKIVENDWGFRREKNIKIFRYEED